MVRDKNNDDRSDGLDLEIAPGGHVGLTPRRSPMERTCRIFLVGLRGSGKTTIARLLAERIGWNWTDADDVIEQRHGKTIRELFAEEGEASFRDKESKILVELCGLDRHVIATG